MPRPRHSIAGTILLVLTCGLGLGSRRYARHLPGFVATYAGDTLWALALFLFLGLILPRVATGRVAALALTLSLLDELGQLYHAPWIDAVRQTTLGGLVLGFGFLWSDLICYAVGISLGVVLECGLIRVHRLWTNRAT
jgi:hypothetical protein